MKNFKKNFVISFVVSALITGLYYIDLKHTERSEATTKSISKTLEYEFGECANKSITELRTEDVSCQNQD